MWLDAYFRIWSRYHVYGIGIIFGWTLYEIRQGTIFYKSKILISILMF